MTEKQEEKYKKQNRCHISREEVNDMFNEDESHCTVCGHCHSKETPVIFYNRSKFRIFRRKYSEIYSLFSINSKNNNNNKKLENGNKIQNKI